jgi:hypothetical protein
MGLMDKVKAQATQIAQKTQEVAQGVADQGKSKLDQVQGGRRADTLFRNLGATVYAERTGRAAPDSQAKIDQLVAELQAHEAQNGINLSSQPDPTQPVPPQGYPQPGGNPQSGPFPGGQSGPFPGGQPQSGPFPGGQPQSGPFPGGQPQSGPFPGGQPQSGPFPQGGTSPDEPQSGPFPG